MRRILVLAGLGLAGCVTVQPGPQQATPLQVAAPANPAQMTFAAVVASVEPVAEAICRERNGFGTNCDLQIVVDPRADLPPNAFQTVDRAGRPIIGFTQALIADARNADEIAFVMGHESAHHIAGHIPRREQSAMAGALVAGVLAQASGADAAAIREIQQLGAEVGARSYSKEFELEADALGAEIALRAGFDPVRGAAFFNRLPDPGDEFLGSHPPNADRIAIVRRTVAGLQGQ
jgi:predicted Zn-dependent protease